MKSQDSAIAFIKLFQSIILIDWTVLLMKPRNYSKNIFFKLIQFRQIYTFKFTYVSLLQVNFYVLKNICLHACNTRKSAIDH